MDVDELQRYLVERLGPLEITSLRRSFPGHSRETWIVQTAAAGGLVVRVDHPGGPSCRSR